MQYADVVNGLALVEVDHGSQYGTEVIGRRLVAERRINGRQLDVMQPPDKVRALAADGNDVAFNLVGFVALKALGQQFENVGVIGAGQTGVAGNNYVQAVLDGAAAEQRQAFDFAHGVELTEQLAGQVAVIAAALGVLLGPPQLAGADQFHGLGNLPRIADGTDAAFKGDQAGHLVTSPYPCQLVWKLT